MDKLNKFELKEKMERLLSQENYVVTLAMPPLSKS